MLQTKSITTDANNGMVNGEYLDATDGGGGVQIIITIMQNCAELPQKV